MSLMTQTKTASALILIMLCSRLVEKFLLSCFDFSHFLLSRCSTYQIVFGLMHIFVNQDIFAAVSLYQFSKLNTVQFDPATTLNHEAVLFVKNPQAHT